MRWLSIGTMSLLLAGCSQTLLVKDGLTPQQFEADKFDCEQKVITMYGGYAQMGAGHAIMARQDMFRCMGAKGYREATAEEYQANQKANPVSMPKSK
jgi:hypothetical protein